MLCTTDVSHGEEYDREWDVAAATTEPSGGVAQNVEEEGRDVREALMRYLNR